ncbi:MAG: ArsR/SmtB family transcription factor [Candidatus Hydrothermarchaeales archaeon]
MLEKGASRIATSEEKLLILPLNDDTSRKISQVLANETSRKILEALCDEPLSTKQISEKLNLPLTTLHYNIENLLDAGLIKVEEAKYSRKGREVKVYAPTRKFIVIAPENMGREEAKNILRKALFGIYFLLVAVGSGYLFQRLYYRYLGITEGELLVSAPMEMAREGLPTKALEAVPKAPTMLEPNLHLWFLFGAIFALVLIFVWRNLEKKVR